MIANCTVRVARPTTVTDQADEVDTMIPVYTGLPMSITEMRDATPGGGTSRQFPRQVHTHRGRYWREVDMRLGDRLIDESTGIVYLVDAMGDPRGLTGRLDRRVDLRRIG